jgi:hypothetical protein
MRIKETLAIVILLFILPSFSSFAQKPGLTGEWKLNTEKTVLADNQLFLSGIKVMQKNDSLLITRTYQNSNGDEYPFDENLSLDGKESKITIYDMPRTSKATKSADDGSILIESTTTFSGQNGDENLISKESWNVDSEGKLLTINFTNKMSNGTVTGTNFYNKVK